MRRWEPSQLECVQREQTSGSQWLHQGWWSDQTESQLQQCLSSIQGFLGDHQMKLCGSIPPMWFGIPWSPSPLGALSYSMYRAKMSEGKEGGHDDRFHKERCRLHQSIPQSDVDYHLSTSRSSLPKQNINTILVSQLNIHDSLKCTTAEHH